MPRIAIPDDWPSVLAASPAFQKLSQAGEVQHFDTLPGSEAELIRRMQSADIAINIRASSHFTKSVFERCPGLRMLSLWGTGTDDVDLRSAEALGVTVTNTPGVSAASVAEHALALMLALARGIPAQDAAVRQGSWPRGAGTELYGKTLGIVGLGAIGSRFARIAQGIGMRVIAWTMGPDQAPGFERVDLDELLRASDVVSIHLRLSPQSEGFIGRRELSLMKPTAILVNTARGAIVDEAALLDVLSRRAIFGAGLDVFAHEPLAPGHPLTKLSNVVLTPHSAGITPEALEAGLQLAVENVRYFLRGEASKRRRGRLIRLYFPYFFVFRERT